jgi:hypothetical protein
VRFQNDSFGSRRQHPNFCPVDGDERFVGSVDFVGRNLGKVTIDLIIRVESVRIKFGFESGLTDQPPDRRVTLLAKVRIAACG